MCADILIALGYEDVVLIAPRGGSDGGMDITFKNQRGENGLACVTLRQDIMVKFREDFSQRTAGEFDTYILFCTAYLTHKQKLECARYCLDTLQAEFVPKDIEALRSLLDSSLKSIRESYLDIKDDSKGLSEEALIKLQEEMQKQAVWGVLKDDLLTIKRNAGSVYNYLWQHYSIKQVEQNVRNELTAITEASGILQEYPEVAQKITDFVHFANIVIERKKGHEFSSREDKDENDKELTRRYQTLVETCNRLMK